MTADCYKGYSSPHEPTELTRELVRNLYAVGVKQDEIARRLNIHDETLRKYYRKELDEGLQDMNIVAMNVLFEKVKEGSLKAATSWLKMKAGWYEAKAPEDIDAVKSFAMDLLRVKSKDESD